ncbi:MAG: CBS domain-containing protein [Ignavibacteria bacterium]|nr:CBS domain-containing protein [Ignavibacteria bacterium]
MVTVKHILQGKGKQVWSVTPDTKVYDVLQLMAEKNVGAVLVIENGRLEGIFSERDYARKVALEGKSSRQLPVKDIMSSRVLFVNPRRSAEECMALMIKKRIRHLPVYENEELQGLISIGDVVKAVLDDKEFMIDQLEQYITNRR